MRSKQNRNIAIIFLTLLIAFIIQSCSENKTNTTDTATTATTPTTQVTTTDTSGKSTVAAPQTQMQVQQPAASGVKHYICPNNCPGSGGDAQANCPVCKTAYVHNDAFHQQPNPAAPTIQQTPTSLQLNPPSAGTPQINPQTLPAPEASTTNARGEYHYTCSAGHPGGSSTAGKCTSCGKDLAHNDNYHK